jgi:hypothetical protein
MALTGSGANNSDPFATVAYGSGSHLVACAGREMRVTGAGASDMTVICEYGVHRLGAATTYVAAKAQEARTALPAGTAAGTLLISSVHTSAPSNVSMEGWTKAYDSVSATRSLRLTTWWRVALRGEAAPVATLSAPARVSMITLAFTGIDPQAPVRSMGTGAGLTAPTGPGVDGGMWLHSLGAEGPRLSVTPPDGATSVGVLAKGDNVTAQAVSASESGTSPPSTWSARRMRAAVAGLLGLGPAPKAPVPPGATAVAAGANMTVSCGALALEYEVVSATVLSVMCKGDETSTATSPSSSTPTATSAASAAPATISPAGSAPTTPTPTRDAVTWPTAPPAQICGNASMLDGPATAPAGAVTVNVGDNLESLTGSKPAGTTFWLKPGIHHFTYSVVPKDGNTYIGAPGAIVDGGGTEGIAFWEEFYGQKAKNVTLSYLTIQNFTSSSEDQGSVYAGDSWKISHSTFKNHGYIAMFAGPNNLIEYNCFDSNGQMGVGTYRFDDNNYNIVVDHNEFKNNNTRRLENCGCAGGMKWWLARHGKFTNNWVHDNLGVGVWADYNNIEILFEGNYIADNHDVGIFYEISYNFMIRYNTIIRNTLVTGAAANDSFPNGGIYISESGGVNVPGYLYSTSEIHHNYLEDNWDGVAIWESGNRYDGSNEYSNNPAYGDPTHWKSQNILVHDNEFRMNKAVAGCSGNRYCGRNGVFSEWVPVPGPAISPNATNDEYQVAVSFAQNNVFSNNKYFGSWTFVSYDQGSVYDWSTWQAPKPDPTSSFNYISPGAFGFGQDVGSTYDGSATP